MNHTESPSVIDRTSLASNLTDTAFDTDTLRCTASMLNKLILSSGLDGEQREEITTLASILARDLDGHMRKLYALTTTAASVLLDDGRQPPADTSLYCRPTSFSKTAKLLSISLPDFMEFIVSAGFMGRVDDGLLPRKAHIFVSAWPFEDSERDGPVKLLVTPYGRRVLAEAYRNKRTERQHS